MEDLFTIIFFIVVALVQGLAVKKKADKNRPARQKRRSRTDSSPQQPVSWRDQAEDPSLSPKQWLHEIMKQEKLSRKQRKAAPKPVDIPEYRPVAPTMKTAPSVISEKTAARQERTGLPEEEQVRASEQVMEKSMGTALPNAVKMGKTMTAPRQHPVRVSTKNLRQAVIMSEVLARPRAFDL